MKFGSVALSEAAGHVLAHNIVNSSGRRVLRKGRQLSADDVEKLRRLGRKMVTVARLEPGDVDEDHAAQAITEHHCDGLIRLTGPATGRVNVHATQLSVVRVQPERLLELNRCEGITLSVMADWSVVEAERMVATTKILPYALSEGLLTQALALPAPILRMEALPRCQVHLIVTAGVGSRERTLDSFARALGRRLEALGSSLVGQTAVDSDEGAQNELAAALGRAHQEGADLIIIAGETAIQDRHDFAPVALEQAGGSVTCYGAPVDPGNLLMLGELDGVSVLGAPGCARSPKRNIVDLLLPRLLLGERVERDDVLKLGHGGLLEDVGERPLPRRQIDDTSPTDLST